MSEKKILHLTLKKEWFDEIAMGKKKSEYREDKPYWRKRLIGSDGIFKQFDEVHFRNGYSKNSPFMRVEFITTSRILNAKDIWIFGIYLGDILEIRNWKEKE